MSSPRLRWLDRNAQNFDALLDLIPDDALASPRRSVVPLVEFCRDLPSALFSIGGATGIDISDATDLLFEYDVPVQKGRGKPSFTDLMIISDSAVVGIEAKYTEPEYESVRKWLRDPRERNREDVLNGWLELVGNVATEAVTIDDVLDLPYQLIHRIAPVCSVNRATRAAVYLVFGSAAAHYAKHVQKCSDLFGAGSAALVVVSCPFTPTESYLQLLARWDAGERRLGKEVRSALRAGQLMVFDNAIVQYSNRNPNACVS